MLGSIAALAFPLRAGAGSLEELSIETNEGSVASTRYAADGSTKRSAVLVLHGSRGIELKPRAYERYANALVAADIDAYLVQYFTTADRAVLDRKSNTPEAIDAYRTADSPVGRTGRPPL